MPKRNSKKKHAFKKRAALAKAKRDPKDKGTRDAGVTNHAAKVKSGPMRSTVDPAFKDPLEGSNHSPAGAFKVVPEVKEAQVPTVQPRKIKKVEGYNPVAKLRNYVHQFEIHGTDAEDSARVLQELMNKCPVEALTKIVSPAKRNPHWINAAQRKFCSIYLFQIWAAEAGPSFTVCDIFGASRHKRLCKAIGIKHLLADFGTSYGKDADRSPRVDISDYVEWGDVVLLEDVYHLTPELLHEAVQKCATHTVYVISRSFEGDFGGDEEGTMLWTRSTDGLITASPDDVSEGYTDHPDNSILSDGVSGLRISPLQSCGPYTIYRIRAASEKQVMENHTKLAVRRMQLSLRHRTLFENKIRGINFIDRIWNTLIPEVQDTVLVDEEIAAIVISEKRPFPMAGAHQTNIRKRITDLVNRKNYTKLIRKRNGWRTFEFRIIEGTNMHVLSELSSFAPHYYALRKNQSVNEGLLRDSRRHNNVNPGGRLLDLVRTLDKATICMGITLAITGSWCAYKYCSKQPPVLTLPSIPRDTLPSIPRYTSPLNRSYDISHRNVVQPRGKSFDPAKFAGLMFKRFTLESHLTSTTTRRHYAGIGQVARTTSAATSAMVRTYLGPLGVRVKSLIVRWLRICLDYLTDTQHSVMGGGIRNTFLESIAIAIAPLTSVVIGVVEACSKRSFAPLLAHTTFYLLSQHSSYGALAQIVLHNGLNWLARAKLRAPPVSSSRVQNMIKNNARCCPDMSVVGPLPILEAVLTGASPLKPVLEYPLCGKLRARHGEKSYDFAIEEDLDKFWADTEPDVDSPNVYGETYNMIVHSGSPQPVIRTPRTVAHGLLKRMHTRPNTTVVGGLRIPSRFPKWTDVYDLVVKTGLYLPEDLRYRVDEYLAAAPTRVSNRLLQGFVDRDEDYVQPQKWSVFVKTEALLKNRPRVIVNVDGVDQVQLIGAAKAIKVLGSNEYWARTWMCGDIPVLIFWASSKKGVDLTEMKMMCEGVDNVITVSGDDCSPKLQGNWLANDFSKFDGSRSADSIQCQVDIYKHLGVPSDVADKVKANSCFKYKASSGDTLFAGEVEHYYASGSLLTTIGNNMDNLNAHAYVFNKVLAEGMELTPAFSLLETHLGFKQKLVFCKGPHDLEFLKGWWVPTLHTGEVWLNLPCSFIKATKISKDPSIIYNTDLNTALYNLAADTSMSWQEIPRDYPVFGWFLQVCDRLGTKSSVSIDTITDRNYKTKLTRIASDLDVDAIKAMICARYDITVIELDDLEAQMKSITTLPWLLDTPAIYKIAKRDYM